MTPEAKEGSGEKATTANNTAATAGATKERGASFMMATYSDDNDDTTMTNVYCMVFGRNIGVVLQNPNRSVIRNNTPQ